MQWARGEKISHLFNITKQNDPRQTYLHISAATNLQYESLWQEIIMSIKQYGKMEIKNIMKNTYAAFFTIWNTRNNVQMWASSGIPYITLFCHQQTHTIIFIFFSCTMHYTFQHFRIVRSMFHFLFNRSQSTASIINQMSHLFFFFLKLKNIFLLFSTFWKWSYSERCFNVDQRCETRRSK